MQVAQLTLRKPVIDVRDFADLAVIAPDLVLAFGSVNALQAAAGALALAFAGAHRAGCTTAGEISQQGVDDGSLVVTALKFEKARVAQVSTTLAGMEDSRDAGQRLAMALPRAGLRAIIPSIGQASFRLQRMTPEEGNNILDIPRLNR